MSTDNPMSSDTGAPGPVTLGTTAGMHVAQAPNGTAGDSAGTPSPGEQISSGSEGESWFGRHYALLVAAAVAIVVAAVAIAGLAYYRGELDDRNSANETAFVSSVEDQGATVETVECNGDTCAAVIGGQAYTVLVQEDEDGEKHFGVSAYAGD